MKGGTGTGTTVNNNHINTNNINEQQLQDQTTTFDSWGTWEELLLACAVKRHGVNNWDSVAMELQGKTSLPHLLITANNCKLKYHDLRRRFNSEQPKHKDDLPPPPDRHQDPDNIPWLDDLRKLRVAQLRQELHRYDVSIVSLQLKVKRLEEEREERLKDDEAKPDLEEEEDSKRHRSENDKKLDRSKADQESQSVNGSNSTCSKNLDQDNKPGPKDRVVTEPDPLPARSVEPSRTRGGQSESDSDKGSSETVARKRRKPGGKRKGGAAALSFELGGDSAGELRESSEAQSSASLTRKWNGKRRRRLELPEQQQRNNEELLLEKSQPLVGVLQMIRAQEHSSLFERRLPTQESAKYKSMVQQHLDLGTIQAKLHKDSYSSCALSFYRDLLLLFNNAVVYFPKSSVESSAANQLRRLVLNEMKKKNIITRPKPDSCSPVASESLSAAKRGELERSDSLLAKQKSTAPIIVCRKRSSISSKHSASAAAAVSQAHKSDEKKVVAAAAFDLKASIDNKKVSSSDGIEEEHGGGGAKAKDNSVTTGTRSSRRTNNGSNANSNKKQSASQLASLKAETSPKGDKKAAALDKKRSAAADFLKRIKRNSPADSLKSNRSGGDEQQKRRGGGGGGSGSGKVERVKERVSRQSGGGDKKKQANKEESSSPSKRSVGRPSKKAAAEVPASTKRTRENGGKQEGSTRPKKRSRR